MLRTNILFLFLTLGTFMAWGQIQNINGTVQDESGQPLPGVTVIVEGTSQGTITNLDGEYAIDVNTGETLTFSFIGYATQQVEIGTQSVINITLLSSTEVLEEVVVVGYGVQKKASVVGAITQTKGEDLKKAGSLPNLSNALTGLLPGVTTTERGGEPGENQTDIFVRGRSTWNESSPLILVDGIEREMSDVDPNEVESVSVLKDASATAVYGVKGGNGVILITTKRGKSGKPALSIEVNRSYKTISKIPQVLNSYQGRLLKNQAIEHGVPAQEAVWGNYTPVELLEYYDKEKYPADEYPMYSYLFPDVDWDQEMTYKWAKSTKVSVNIGGGTDFVKYYSSLSYLSEGDILRTEDFGQGYDPNYSFERFNFRTNLDFNLTKTTLLKTNIAGNHSIIQKPRGGAWSYRTALYHWAPDFYPVQYPDGTFGEHLGSTTRDENPIVNMNFNGYTVTNSTNVNTDIALEQKLDFIVKGLSFNAKAAFDIGVKTSGANVNDSKTIKKHIDPSILDAKTLEDSLAAITYKPYDGDHGNNENTGYNDVMDPFTVQSESMSKFLYQSLYYQLQLNYANTFGRHDITGLAVFNRYNNLNERQVTEGNNEFGELGYNVLREDWVGRITYNYDKRYLLEVNGAYNGSDQFGPGYQFDFFPSFAAGWLISNEGFVKDNAPFINNLKIRGSYGKTGNDEIFRRVNSTPLSGSSTNDDTYVPYAYLDQWGNPTNSTFQYAEFGRLYDVKSLFLIWDEISAANPDLQWEVAYKQNVGAELGVFNNLLSFTFDYFWEQRDKVFILKEERIVSDQNGAVKISGNVGEVKVHGWEFEAKVSKAFSSGLHLWGSYNHTFATDEVIVREDPELQPAYQKREGFPIDQTTTHVNTYIIQDWNQIYGGVMGTNNAQALPGQFRQIDFNADGVIDEDDRIPYGYPNDRPQYTYSLSFGSGYKGLSFMMQFYGVYNITRKVSLGEFGEQRTVVRPFHRDEAYSPEADRTETATYSALRFNANNPTGNYYFYDGSFLRLKNVELAYTLTNETIKRIGIQSLRVFGNGNNVFIWSKLPEDSETGDFTNNTYPITRRFNIGFDIRF